MNSKIKVLVWLLLLIAVPVTLSGCQDFVNDLKDIDPEEATRVELLFVQTAEGGSFTPLNIDESPRYRLEFRGVAPITSYFSDRPIRIAGSMTTGEFLNLGKFTNTPPNAAIVLMDHNNSNEDIIVGILSNPQYDAAAETLSYDIFALSESPNDMLNRWPGLEDSTLPRTFGAVSIFIDDVSGCESIDSLACRHGTF